MGVKQILPILLALWLVGLPFASFVSAKESEVQILRQEVRELKKTVDDLKKVVEEKKVAQEIPPESSSSNPTRQIGFWKYPLRSGGASKLLPDISLIGIFSGAYFTKDPGERGDDPRRTGFNFQEIELGIQSIIDPYVRGDVFLSFSEEGVSLEEAYATSLSLPKGLQVRAGKYKLAFGRQNQKHTEVRPFVNDNWVNQIIFGGEGFNESGVELSYLFPTPFFLQGQFSFTQGDNPENFDGYRKQDFAYTGRLSTSVDLNNSLTALVGASGAFGFNNTDRGNLTQIYGGDFLLKWRPSPATGIDWQSEYIYRKRQVPGGAENEGGLSSYLLGQWSKRWGAGLRLDYVGLPEQQNRQFRLSPMMTFMPTEFFRLRVQYDYQHERGLDPVHAAYLQMIFNMGSHGAHQF